MAVAPTPIDTDWIASGPLYVASTNGIGYRVLENVMLVSETSYAFNLTGSDLTLEVAGYVHGQYGAILGNTDSSTGIRLSVEASGDLIGTRTGAWLYGQSELHNAGEIRGGNVGAFISIEAAVTARVTNEGLISGGNVGLVASSHLGRLEVTNRGTIVGRDHSYRGDYNEDILANRGRLLGDVDLGLGADLLDNRGGQVRGTVFGGEGADRLVPGLEAEVWEGGDGLDTADFRTGGGLRVSLADATGTGRAAGDVFRSIEVVLGSSTGADGLIGDNLANTLWGFGGNDALLGQGGNDVLAGGAGVDVLRGGMGNDAFRFNASGEGADVIRHWGVDPGDNDRFHILATGFGGGLVAGTLATPDQFSEQATLAAATPDVRFILRTGDKTLWFDRDGSGTTAAPIRLADLPDLAIVSSGDFVLV